MKTLIFDFQEAEHDEKSAEIAFETEELYTTFRYFTIASGGKTD